MGDDVVPSPLILLLLPVVQHPCALVWFYLFRSELEQVIAMNDTSVNSVLQPIHLQYCAIVIQSETFSHKIHPNNHNSFIAIVGLML